ncbi:MAG: HAMP domain-containing sensor histidine kinase [Planctomycetota bacterium]
MARLDVRDLEGWDQDVASLAGALVHEVKNPLSTLNINTQLILEEWPEPETPREQRMAKRLGVMRGEIGRIQSIVDSFLRFVREPQITPALVDVTALLAELVEGNREGFERAGIRMRFQPDPEPCRLMGDEGLLRQVFLNLVRNAEHAMPDGGELMLRTDHQDSDIVVEVIDTGDGIPEARLPEIFRPYVSSRPGGTGLGLPTTSRIVHHHGGHIVVESDEGKGSRFSVFLPATTDA